VPRRGAVVLPASFLPAANKERCCSSMRALSLSNWVSNSSSFVCRSSVTDCLVLRFTRLFPCVFPRVFPRVSPRVLSLVFSDADPAFAATEAVLAVGVSAVALRLDPMNRSTLAAAAVAAVAAAAAAAAADECADVINARRKYTARVSAAPLIRVSKHVHSFISAFNMARESACVTERESDCGRHSDGQHKHHTTHTKIYTHAHTNTTTCCCPHTRCHCYASSTHRHYYFPTMPDLLFFVFSDDTLPYHRLLVLLIIISRRIPRPLFCLYFLSSVLQRLSV